MPVSGLTLGVDFNYYGRHYADFAAADRTDEKDRAEAWKLPDYSTVDLNLNYDFKMGTFQGQLFGNVNNLFNRKYISDQIIGSSPFSRQSSFTRPRWRLKSSNPL